MKISKECGYLLLRLREDRVSIIVREVWNASPLTLQDADLLYTDFQQFDEQYHCRQYRIVAHGGYLAEALSFELYGLTVSDASYLASLRSGYHVELFAHNEAAFRAIESGFARSRIGAVVQATGTGKSFLIARYIVKHRDERVLVLTPNVTIISEIKKAVGKKMPHVVYKTFQGLASDRSNGLDLKADHIVIDEFHHFGAAVWGRALQDVIDANPKARVLGMSATPIRPDAMLDTVEVYFNGNLFYELSLSMAWQYGILPVPLLVQSMFDLDGQLDKIQHQLDQSDCTSERRRRVQEKIHFARLDFRGSRSATELIRQYLPKTVRKLLVFCKDKEDLQVMIPEVTSWLSDAGFSVEVFQIHNGFSFRDNTQTLKSFRQDSECLHVLFSINMLIEGLHVEGVDAAMFLRRTESYVVALQQLGRCLKAGFASRPVILDFVNNLSGRSVYEAMSREWNNRAAERAPMTFKGTMRFQVTGFLSDIRLQVDEMLAELDAWPVMYERLLEFRDREDRWPLAAEGKLGIWCNTQRMARKKGTLSDEYIVRLSETGFEWEIQDSCWMRNFEQLKAFYATQGYWPKQGEDRLNNWCNTQRQAKKKGFLSEERLALLESIGFWWEQDLDKVWLDRWTEVQQFYAARGRWPKSSDGKLGTWCSTQRKTRRQGLLQPERAALLDGGGFLWGMDDMWQENYEKLCRFYQSHGRWPTAREEQLGSWCFVQRRALKRGQLTAERVRLLAIIGLTADVK